MEHWRATVQSVLRQLRAAAIKCRFCGEELGIYEDEAVLFSGRLATIYSVGQFFAVLFTLGNTYLVYLIRRLP